MFSMPDIAVIVLVVLFIFGPKKLPEIGSALGKGIKGFKKATDEAEGLLSDKEEEKLEAKPAEKPLEKPLEKPVAAAEPQKPGV